MRQTGTAIGPYVLLGAMLVLSGCGGRGGETSAVPLGLPVSMQMPKSISPASVHAPPMAQTPIQPSSAMMSIRRPKNDIQAPGWTQLPGGAVSVAASPDGSIWVLSSQGTGLDRSIWHYVNGVWANIPGAAMRLSVAPNSTLWVVNSAGGIYAYDGTSWSTIAGGASDISAASDGSVYVVSNQGGGSVGRGIWHYGGGAWSQMPGAAVSIAASWDTGTYQGNIDPGGYYVTNAAGSIYHYTSASGYTQLSGAAAQLAPTTSGGLFALGYPASAGGNPIYYNNLSSSSWSQQPGAAVSIATDSVHVYAIGAAGGIYQSQILAALHQPSIVGVGCGALCQVSAPYTGAPIMIASGINPPYSGGATVSHSLVRTPSGSIVALHLYLGPGTQGTVSIYAPPFSGVPQAVTNGVGQPTAITVSPSSGYLFVSSLHPYQNPTNTITVYAPPYTGAPVATIPTGSGAMVVDSGGFLLVAAAGGVDAYAPPYTTPPVSLPITSDGINDIVVDSPTTNLFALSSNDQAFYVYPNSNTPVVTTVPIAHGDLANELAIDGQGNLFVAINGRGIGYIPGAVNIYAPPSYKLSSTITTGSFLPRDIALDTAGNLFIAGYNGAGVRIYAPPYTMAPITIPGLSDPIDWIP